MVNGIDLDFFRLRGSFGFGTKIQGGSMKMYKL